MERERGTQGGRGGACDFGGASARNALGSAAEERTDVEYDRMLAELFAEEDRARGMAHRLMEIAKNPRAALVEKASLIAFLRGPMEKHMRHEEERIFPHLDKHGLAAETQVSVKQHEAVRALATRLDEAKPEEVAGLFIDTAKLLLHHTNFEGDYIYPELSLSQWRSLMAETAKADSVAPEFTPDVVKG